MCMLAQFALLLAIYGTFTRKDDGVNATRLSLLALFAFTAGINVGSWIQLALRQAGLPLSLDNQLVYDAFAITSVLFSLFTVTGLLATPGILFITIATILVGSTVIFWSAIASLFGLVSLMTMNAIYIKLGLVVSSLYIIFDTWMIHEDVLRGHRDVIGHSVRLLSDFLKVFMRLVVLLSKNKKKKS